MVVAGVLYSQLGTEEKKMTITIFYLYYKNILLRLRRPVDEYIQFIFLFFAISIFRCRSSRPVVEYSIYLFMYVCMYVYMYVMYVYVYVCMYVCIT